MGDPPLFCDAVALGEAFAGQYSLALFFGSRPFAAAKSPSNASPRAVPTRNHAEAYPPELLRGEYRLKRMRGVMCASRALLLSAERESQHRPSGKGMRRFRSPGWPLAPITARASRRRIPFPDGRIGAASTGFQRDYSSEDSEESLESSRASSCSGR